jgi:phosphate-selective porin
MTGEIKADGLAVPRRPLFRGGIGAVEFAARLERLTFGSAADDRAPSAAPRAEVIEGNSDRVETAGVNWYMNRWMKVQFNIIHDTVRDPSQGPNPDRAGFWSHVLRFQLSL